MDSVLPYQASVRLSGITALLLIMGEQQEWQNWETVKADLDRNAGGGGPQPRVAKPVSRVLNVWDPDLGNGWPSSSATRSPPSSSVQMQFQVKCNHAWVNFDADVNASMVEYTTHFDRILLNSSAPAKA